MGRNNDQRAIDRSARREQQISREDRDGLVKPIELLNRAERRRLAKHKNGIRAILPGTNLGGYSRPARGGEG
jgi:hypothetical protein